LNLHSVSGWPVSLHTTETVGLLIVKSAITVSPLTLGLLFMNSSFREGSKALWRQSL